MSVFLLLLALLSLAVTAVICAGGVLTRRRTEEMDRLRALYGDRVPHAVGPLEPLRKLRRPTLPAADVELEKLVADLPQFMADIEAAEAQQEAALRRLRR